MKVRGWGVEAIVSNYGEESFARFVDPRGRRGRGVLVAVARGDLRRDRGRGVAREERMRAFAAVFAREVFERRMVFVVGLFCGVLALFAAALARMDDAGRRGGARSSRARSAASRSAPPSRSSTEDPSSRARRGRRGSRSTSPGRFPPPRSGAASSSRRSSSRFATAPPRVRSGLARGARRGAAASGASTLTPGLSTAIGALGRRSSCVLAAHALVTVARLRSPWVALDLLLAPTLALLAAACVRSLVRDSGSEAFDDASPANGGAPR